MQKHGYKDLFITSQNSIDHAASNIIGLKSVSMIVIVLAVFIAIASQCVDRYIRVYITGLDIDYLDVTMRVEFGSKWVWIG